MRLSSITLLGDESSVAGASNDLLTPSERVPLRQQKLFEAQIIR